jgi:D-psicose/D-tagatose/L-ribulose 3-epimerase
LDEPAVNMMIDTFHMNIEERDMVAGISGIADILSHVHLSETNRAVLGTGHWPTREFLAELNRVGYKGSVSVGVYNTALTRRECISGCKAEIQRVVS